jgi:hypothetical protein
MTIRTIMISAAYVAFLSAPASAFAGDIVSTTGGIVILGATLPSGVIGGNWLVHNGGGLTEVAFEEAKDYTLTSPLSVDAGASPIVAGVKVSSVLVDFNSKTLVKKISSITFDQKVLGVEFAENSKGISTSLVNSDFLGRTGETYDLGCFHCGFESGTSDSVVIDGDTVIFSNTYQESGDYARVILAASGVPEPATWGMLLFGAGFIGAALRSRPRAFSPAA